MGLEPFTPEDPIFKNEDVLRDSHQPPNLVEREEELKTYQDGLKPVIKGDRPRNIFIYGQTGVGKTVATQLVMDRLRNDQRRYNYLDIQVHYIVCKNLNTSYQVAVKLVNQFRDQQNQIPSTGYPPDTVYQKLWDELRSTDASHVLFILDEVDAIGDDDAILYEVPRANDTNGPVPADKTKIGVVGISNNFTFRDGLSSQIKDSLCDEEIHFPPYTPAQLENILQKRKQEAFVDGVLTDDVIPKTAAMAGNESGSARQALKLLYTAGDIARRNNEEKVTREHVQQAEPKVKESQVKNELESLPMQSHLTLYAVFRLYHMEHLPAKSSTIYDQYCFAAGKIGADVKTDRTIRDRLTQLKLKGFLDAELQNKGRSGGSYFLYHFGDIRPEIVEEILKDTHRLDELFERSTTQSHP